MPKQNLNDLQTFIAVAREGSFTRAAAQLGVSQSALSQTVRELESRLGIRLLNRTTRSVSPTEAGERLLATVAPRFEEIEAELLALSELRDKPAGMIRITASGDSADSILLPKLVQILPDYPDLKIEINTDYRLIDIVEHRFDAGVRLGDQVAKDMIAVRIGPDLPMALVASPTYFEKYGVPKKPEDLTEHNCINIRLPTHGGLYAWELKKGKRELNLRMDGQLIVCSMQQQVYGAMQGLGLAFTLKDRVQPLIDQGHLQSVLEDWCPTFPGYHLYYPSRRQSSPALALLIDILRYRK
ncbi:LysR family transcriptional regulator [Ralstonia soli]|uniref:LysR family transcriptional regulator n=1 Tax=Ralstonia soli TaxID=2953896 RepID=A0ABT1AE70_9RALS|nr:LysR family transcriptional regulator [Ralstonia soli]MCO5396682.1 LysR family transcriptional regulator [Ralstonia soli]